MKFDHKYQHKHEAKYILSSRNAYRNNEHCLWMWMYIKGANEMKITNEMSNIQTTKHCIAGSMTLCIVKFVHLIAVFQHANVRVFSFHEINANGNQNERH